MKLKDLKKLTSISGKTAGELMVTAAEYNSDAEIVSITYNSKLEMYTMWLAESTE